MTLVPDQEPCPKCGSTLWVIDMDGGGNFWLLCMGTRDQDCFECRELPTPEKETDHEETKRDLGGQEG